MNRKETDDLLWELKSMNINGVVFYSEDSIKLLLDTIFSDFEKNK